MKHEVLGAGVVEVILLTGRLNGVVEPEVMANLVRNDLAERRSERPVA